MKTCKRCNVIQEETEFRIHTKGLLYRRGECNSCRREIEKERFAKKVKPEKPPKPLTEKQKMRLSGIYQCTQCKEIKPLIEFNKSNKDGLVSKCKICQKDKYTNNKERYSKHTKEGHYRRMYGISLEQRNEMIKDKMCEICNEVPAIFIDHCHTTNKIRGVLCRKCNSGLGFFKDSIKSMTKAIQYLEIANETNNKK